MNDEPRSYVVAGQHAWSRAAFDDHIAGLPGRWTFIGEAGELTADKLAELQPRYVFFLHWSTRVPEAIVAEYECVCFHMTDVPFGRGGSPLQNLILAGHTSTQLTALRMVEAFDAGPVYYKVPLPLDGSAQEIYGRAMRVAATLIERFVAEQPTPVPQQGEATVFRRRKPADSELPERASAAQLYDFIRMLDAEGYPHAFVRHGALRLEFRDAVLRDGFVEARAIIRTEGDQP
ncbi:MAG TPA: hypothetical protein VM364_14325 [Vicinamibacterales bacterium]|nr:hypothetical protein [Vicinamibacterales bacterium]